MTEDTAKADVGQSEEKVNCFCMGAGPELYGMLKKLGPDAACQHFRNARIEMLKGMRALIDARIETIRRDEAKKGTKVTVE